MLLHLPRSSSLSALSHLHMASDKKHAGRPHIGESLGRAAMILGRSLKVKCSSTRTRGRECRREIFRTLCSISVNLFFSAQKWRRTGWEGFGSPNAMRVLRWKLRLFARGQGHLCGAGLEKAFTRWMIYEVGYIYIYIHVLVRTHREVG